MSTFAIGDIHGHRALLDRLLEELPLSQDDTLVFIGDYVDRGPDSKGVVERVMEIKKERGDRCVCLLGNHEDMLLDYCRRICRASSFDLSLLYKLDKAGDYGEGFWQTVGGDMTLRSYGGDIPREHIEFLAGLPLVYEEDEFVFVHAGLNARGDTPRGQMLWGAPGFWSDLDPLTGRIMKGARRSFVKTVVVGHTAFEEPVFGPDIIGIDTGAGHGGPLTAIQLPDWIIYQVRTGAPATRMLHSPSITARTPV